MKTARNIVEIGKRLIEVKESLPHGEWGNWLKEKVDFSDRTAQKFMKIYNEFGKTNAPSFLSTEKLWLMLGVPQEQREDFISQSHEVNGENKTVDEMTTRELQKNIQMLKRFNI